MAHTEILSTRRFGIDQGAQFNDFTSDNGWLLNVSLDIDQKHPIEEITIQSSGVVDGMVVKYRLVDGTTSSKSHGTTTATNTKVVSLGADEVIVAVSGKSGVSRWGDHVNQISFSILDTATAQLRVAGPFGGTAGTVFHVEGLLLAFSGSAFDGTEPVGLNSLSFYVTPCNM